jgi:hypothetical protein
MKIKATISIIILFVPILLFAQDDTFYERQETDLSFGVGPSYMFGDAATKTGSGFSKDFAPVNVGLAFNLEYKHYWEAGLAYNISLLYSTYKGNENDSRLGYRGYTFSSHVGELSGQIIFEPISYFSENTYPIDPYLIAGVGVVGAYIPSWKFQSAVRPDDTDKLRHNTIGGAFMGGFGIRFPITSKIDARLESMVHYSTTDYLDGYHPIFSKHSDVYIVSLIKISYRLFGKERFTGYD